MRQKEIRKRTQQGFSLVELMVVVAIIGVLSALAVPRFKVFQAKARQAEAKTNLAHIYTLEQSFHGDNDFYIALTAAQATGANQLGFTVAAGVTTRYDYTVVPGATGILSSFLGTATGKLLPSNLIRSGCGAADTWTITELKVLTPVNDLTKACTN